MQTESAFMHRRELFYQKPAAVACEASLTGMEFASGIPGTLGGALRMNAGAYGGEMKQIVESAEVLTSEGEVFKFDE